MVLDGRITSSPTVTRSRYETGWREPVVGERIEALRAELADGDDPEQVVSAFWTEVRAAGGPLVRPIEGDSTGVAVTFLWRDETGTTEHVGLAGGIVLSDWEQHLLRRLPGTDVFHLTLRLPRDTRTTYSYAPDIRGHWDPWLEAADQWEKYSRFVADPINPRSLLDLDPGRDPELVAALTRPAAGSLHEHTVTSEVLAGDRRYWVYLPPGNDPLENVIWAFDGAGCLGRYMLPPQNLVEHLITSGSIGRTAMVFIDNPPESRQAEVTFAVPLDRFVCEELVTDVRARYEFPTARDRNVVSGHSGGGEAAILSAAHESAHFGHVVATSPGIAYMARGHEPREFYERFRSNPPPPDTRFVLAVGELEVDRVYDIPSLYTATHEFASVLRELDLDVDLLTGPYGHDHFSSHILFAHGLMQLLRSTT
ncbi:enterochelin esterase domain-containing protein [Blastococcus sp. URHD0036]|uniref:enterochelin esterase domain-containing protein n=1 Tax=Blastococcus sp. URHD0036 TaxID=1380356 RepID=UPI0009DD87BA|nr:enterochelin esterase domain-containing protein [Blastococcus sp. URHD0036]